MELNSEGSGMLLSYFPSQIISIECLAHLVCERLNACLAPVAVREGVGGGGFIRKGVAEALGSVGVISVADRCSAVLHLAAIAPAYLAPVAVREGVGGGGFVREGWPKRSGMWA